MGSNNSKKEQYPSIMNTPNINYMINNHGNRSTDQLDIWVKECVFSATGSFQSQTIRKFKE